MRGQIDIGRTIIVIVLIVLLFLFVAFVLDIWPFGEQVDVDVDENVTSPIDIEDERNRTEQPAPLDARESAFEDRTLFPTDGL